MEIRKVPQSDAQAAHDTSSQAFGQGRREEHHDDPKAVPYECYGVYDDDGLQAKVVVVAFHTHLGPEVTVPMGGVAGVSCLPAKRGKGYIGACLDYTLRQMRDKEQTISLLFPFAFDYYRRYGWEWTGIKRKYTVPAAMLKNDPETENVRAALPEDTPAIQAFYTRFAGGYRGMTARTDYEWEKMLASSSDKHTYTYLYEKEGKLEGYLTHKGWSNEVTELREFLCLTSRAQRAFLGLLRRHDMQVEKFEWTAPGNDRFWHQQMHWDIDTKLWPSCQSRIVDVVAALQLWRPAPEAEGGVRFEVTDDHAPWNTGIWQAEFAEGRVQVKRTGQAPQVSLDIQALTQGYFGTPSLEEVRRADRLIVHEEEGYAALNALLAGPPMWINDGF